MRMEWFKRLCALYSDGDDPNTDEQFTGGTSRFAAVQDEE